MFENILSSNIDNAVNIIQHYSLWRDYTFLIIL